MKFTRLSFPSFLLLSAVLAHPLCAQTNGSTDVAEVVSPAAVTDASSSSATVDPSSATKQAADAPAAPAAPRETANKAFSAVGVDVNIGAGGIGFDIATPLARKFNLRGTGYFFRYNATITEDYITYGGDIQLASGGASLDWYPFGGTFRLSGGIVGYNGSELTGSASINPDQSFTLNGDTYYSSATDPAHASATLHLGTQVAPMFSFGWGNIVPRKASKHFSVPVEIGFAYVGYPNVDLRFTGSTCNESGSVCSDVVNNPNFQEDLAAQKDIYRDDLSALRFFPILSIGFGNKF